MWQPPNPLHEAIGDIGQSLMSIKVLECTELLKALFQCKETMGQRRCHRQNANNPSGQTPSASIIPMPLCKRHAMLSDEESITGRMIQTLL
jgi:hypothetical protein